MCGADSGSGPFWCSLEGPPTLLSLEISEDLQVKIAFSEPLETPAPISLADFEITVATALGAATMQPELPPLPREGLD